MPEQVIEQIVAPLKNWPQLSANLIFQNIQQYTQKPNLAVAVPVPAEIAGMTITHTTIEGKPSVAAPAGYALKWDTLIDYKTNATFGDAGTGAWVLVADNTKVTLYKTADGAEYKPSEDGEYNGYGELPAWLTTAARPSTLHTWVDGAWYADPADIAAAAEQAVLTQAQAKISSETARANTIIDTIAPAVAGGYADEGDAAVLAAWQQYRYKLSKVSAQAGYPASIAWPDAPDATPPA